MASLRAHLHVLSVRATVAGQAARGDLASRLLTRRPSQDPYPLYERVREQGTVVRSTLPGIQMSASHAFVTRALRSPELSVYEARRESTLVRPLEDSFLMRNPPDHARLRRMVTPWFTARALQQRRGDLEKIAHGRLDELSDRDTFDIVQDYAVPVAVRIICALTGLPDENWRRLGALGGILPISTDQLNTARQIDRLHEYWRDLGDFLDETVDGGRAPEGSLVRALGDRSADPEELSRPDLMATLGVLLIAGFETSVGLIGNTGLRMMDDAGLRGSVLDDPGTLPGVLEETLRFESPVQYTVRRAERACEIEGVEIPAGGEVLLLLGGTGRDPAVFDEPHRFRPNRPNSRSHLAFSAGEHYCIGAGLARLEAEVTVRALFERRPGLRRAGRPRWQRARNIRALRTVPARSS